MRLRSAFSRRKKLANHKFQIEALIFLFRRIIYIDIHLIWLCKSARQQPYARTNHPHASHHAWGSRRDGVVRHFGSWRSDS